jgi:hypothetical protein
MIGMGMPRSQRRIPPPIVAVPLLDVGVRSPVTVGKSMLCSAVDLQGRARQELRVRKPREINYLLAWLQCVGATHGAKP